MTLLDRLIRPRAVPPGDALYRAIIAEARRPDWYTAGAVADSVDGRFDTVALVLALVLLRLETEGTGAGEFTRDLTERFIADMDGSLRELGIGDPTVGKQIGHMVSALGGRLGAYRDALATDALSPALGEALARNLYRGAAVDGDVLDWTERRVRTLADRLARTPTATLRSGSL